MRTMAATRSSSVESATRVDAGASEGSAQLGLAALGRLLVATPERRIVGVDVELLAGLGSSRSIGPTSGSSTSRGS